MEIKENANNSDLLSKKRTRDESNNNKTKILCPYLSTIKRHLLDFDFEKVCSLNLSNLNIYACLVCGKYYQGKGLNTNAYSHSLEHDHHLFINLNDQRIFCLPENYEVTENSLNDIKYNLKPIYSEKDIEELDKIQKISRAIDGTEYIPGCIGLNNLKMTDYANVIIQSLCRVKDLRDFFLKYDEITDLKLEPNALLVQKWAELLRKIWSKKSFKGHVSPHELMQSVSASSNNKFKINEQSDAINFLTWLLNTLNDYLIRKNKSKSTIISKSFQGKLLVETFTIIKENTIIGINDKIYEENGIKYTYIAKEQNF